MGTGYDWHEVDILAGDTHTADFLAMNPNGKIPLLRLPDGRCLAESNAILCYLADGSEFFYGDAFERATVLRWLFFEQYSHEPYIATSRFIIQYLGSPPERQNDLAQKREGGLKALRIMEQQHEGGFPLDEYPAIRAWIGNIRSRPNFVPMVTK